ncbi:nucleoside diphosphate kinase 2, chloroplastic [Syzygium oleosum]|uniref:nucleoside diphosphate kinase 2, chloroplastic n=1 Tax=Syzygium oleosum TaxID=219896 RepID=UPI0011D26EE7|nr:nucleoside diphosphate kinase 2, chloroplastic [Syzygium oleosum]
MEGVVLGGASSCVFSSSPTTAAGGRDGVVVCRPRAVLSCAPYPRASAHRRLRLSPFPSTSHLFCPAAAPRASRGRTRPRIFLPHLVASSEQVEETYIMIKPDGVQRGLVGEIISRFERKGFKLTGLKLFRCPRELAEEHYKDLQSKPFFPKLIEYITSGPVVCMAWEGVGVVASARKLIGSTNPLQAEPGTIRGDLAVQTGRNVVHGSDSPENGQREIALWFKEGELCQWTPAQASWLRE